MTTRKQPLPDVDDRVGELVRSTAYLIQKVERYVEAIREREAARGLLTTAGRAYETVESAQKRLQYAERMLVGALSDAIEITHRARLMTPALSINEAAESGRSLTQ